MTLQQEVAEKEEELNATRNDLQSAAYTQSLKHTLADKERIIDQLKEDFTTYQTEANNINYHMSQLEKEMFESTTQTVSKAGASVVQNKVKQPNQAKAVQQETKRKEGRVITNRNEPAQRSDSHTSIVKESCKEVSHHNCILAGIGHYVK